MLVVQSHVKHICGQIMSHTRFLPMRLSGCHSIWSMGGNLSLLMDLKQVNFLNQLYLFILIRASGSTADIVQGGVGDCWFLSAVAVLCERPDLMQNIIPHHTLVPNGFQMFRFFLGGSWREILVDRYLPCRVADPRGSSKAAKKS